MIVPALFYNGFYGCAPWECGSDGGFKFVARGQHSCAPWECGSDFVNNCLHPSCLVRPVGVWVEWNR